eukprot:TRINITY_DN7628_c0_g1_i1.p1 TRINITY_DN7628_c0_g1~~TRINITY_DN7628_c0_g1_i1.p1  ORF type:complete len:193 (-),score=14.59 TRINITY_DN7628_c0_g1_i1:400-978(-)
MGFPGFPSISAGLLLIFTAIVSVQPVTGILNSLAKLYSRIKERRWIRASSNEGHEPSSVLGNRLAQLPLVAQDIRDSLPLLSYQSNNGGAVECAVCISKFEEGDEIRRLPCGHFFHSGCLDKWLDHQQTTCPLCRASVVPAETAHLLRRRQQELTEELMFWFASFHGHGFNNMWWLRYGCSCDPSTIARLFN